MVIAGALGGSVNFITEDKKKDDKGILLWVKRVFIGIVASLLIPLFLETISSDLIKNIINQTADSKKDLFVFFGFCLLGAISSRVLIRTLSERIFQEVKEAKQKAEEVDAKTQELAAQIEPIVERATESEENLAEENAVSSEFFMESSKIIDKEAVAVLKALNHPKYTLRSMSGISVETRIPKSLVSEKLNVLILQGLANRIERKNGGIRYAITARGSQYIDNLSLHEAQPI